MSGSNQLTIIERGVKNYPMTAPGETFDDPYSMNVIDICPVGALTSTDWRFKARAWEMSRTPSITIQNAKGANCFYHVRDNVIVKVTPRQNMQVNEYWLADEDRLDYGRFNDDRPTGPQLRSADEELMGKRAGEVTPAEFARLGRPPARYANSGVLLMDVARWRAEDVASRCVAAASDPALQAGYVRNDQSALNIALAGRWTELSPVWNWQWTDRTRLFAAEAGAGSRNQNPISR